MSAWGDGGFRHVDADGRPLSRRESLARIFDRLGTNDLSKQMPKNRYMSAGDRAKLYQWVAAELTAAGGAP